MQPEPATPPEPPPPPPAPRVPPVTYGILAICAAIYLLLGFAPAGAREAAAPVLAPSAVRIWHGAVWGLVTSAVVHFSFWHVFFNAWWTRDFGRLVEPDMRAGRYLGFVVVAATLSSGWQLLVSDTTGVGFSGVVYALFGYAWARRGSHAGFRAFLTRSTIGWMLGWLVLCVVLTLTKTWSVGNAAHIAGLAFGYLVGLWLERPRRRRAAVAGGAVLVVGAVLSCTYVPWSPVWPVRAQVYELELLQRRADAGDPRAQASYGSLLAGVPAKRTEGLTWLRRSAEAGDADAMNSLAWHLATCREDAVRDGAQAVAWAEKAHRLDPAARVADTLAAAYAEAGRWDEAIAAQERAIGKLPGDVGTDVKAGFEERLARYTRHEAWRE